MNYSSSHDVLWDKLPDYVQLFLMYGLIKSKRLFSRQDLYDIVGEWDPNFYDKFIEVFYHDDRRKALFDFDTTNTLYVKGYILKSVYNELPSNKDITINDELIKWDKYA